VRSAFLVPSFDAAAFLSSLSNRHQTLEDLRVELRDLSQSLNKELLDLVNENYQDFLSLGGTLKGGGDRVEDLRVGLLGFQKDILAVRQRVDIRRRELQKLLTEKRRLVGQAEVGRALLEISERIDELESTLMIGSSRAAGNEKPTTFHEFDGESDDNDDEGTVDPDTKGPASLSFETVDRHIQRYLLLKALSNNVGVQHPFLVRQEERISSIRTTLLLDLNTAVRQTKNGPSPNEGKLLRLLRLYDEMDERRDAIAVLQG